MRHTTRGGWKPIKHERILKPDFQNNDDDTSSPDQKRRLRFWSEDGTQTYHGSDKEKLL
ncbi:MAG TPA: hypothetical protein VGD65_12110 [Chryseosolibacter sp.]